MFKTCLSLFAAVALTTSMAFAGSPVWSGDYVEVRSNHILGGGCTYSAEAGDDANQAVAAWRISTGELAGLSVVAVILGEGNLQLGQHDRETILYIDQTATTEQQTQLRDSFSTRYTDLFGTVKKVELADISFRHDGDDTYTISVPGQVQVATRTMMHTDHELACDRMIWYTPFTTDATVSLVQTAKHAYSGSDLIATWSIPNKRSAYVGTFTFAQELATR